MPIGIKQKYLALIQKEMNPTKRFFYHEIEKKYPQKSIRSIDDEWEIYIKAKALMAKRIQLGQEIRKKIEELRLILNCPMDKTLDYLGFTQSDLTKFENGTLCLTKKRIKKIDEKTNGFISIDLLTSFMDAKEVIVE